MKNNSIISLTNSLLFSFPPSQPTSSTCQPHEQTEGYVSCGHRSSKYDVEPISTIRSYQSTMSHIPRNLNLLHTRLCVWTSFVGGGTVKCCQTS